MALEIEIFVLVTEDVLRRQTGYLETGLFCIFRVRASTSINSQEKRNVSLSSPDAKESKNGERREGTKGGRR